MPQSHSILPSPLEKSLRREIATAELGPAAEFIVSRALPCVRFTDAGEMRTQRIGGTRFGGEPDLPQGEAWPQGSPVENGGPPGRTEANFLAQINLADLPKWQGCPLPEAGLLSFFLTRVPEAQTGSLHVRLIPAGTPLVRMKTPDESVLVDAYNPPFKPRKVKPSLGVSLPVHDEPFRNRIEALCEASKEQTGEEFLDESLMEMDSRVGPRDWFAQLLGYAVGSVADQPDHHRMVAHERLKLPGRSWKDFPEADEKRLRRETAQWRLLLHLGSHDPMGACWSDAGYLFAFIKEKPLAKLDFRDVPATIYD
jgi:uncharacterized protein YwqG